MLYLQSISEQDEQFNITTKSETQLCFGKTTKDHNENHKTILSGSFRLVLFQFG